MSKENLPADGAEKKLLKKEEEAKTETRIELADAKFVVADQKNQCICDANIELDANKRYTGLTKEELMKYAEDPFWVRLRWFMFILFWVLWLAMLAGAVAIIIHAPKCAAPKALTWYEKGPIVDMSPAESYKDVEAELSVFKRSQVAGVFTHVCKNVYEVLENESDCLQEFKAFVAKVQEFGVKVIVDLIANYVPKSHKWFQLSENRSAEFSDYFIWAKGREFDADQTSGQPKPPNNWVSTLNEPAWTWSEKREEFYLHHFREDQPDLNFHNPDVVKKFDAVLKLWMDAGAHGIRLVWGRELLVNASLVDEAAETGARAPGADHSQYHYYRHRHTTDQPQLDHLLAHWAYVTQAYGETVFTLKETEGRAELFLLQRNTSALRPPGAAPLVISRGDAAEALLKRLPRWPFLELKGDGDTEVELAMFAMLLPVAPVLAREQVLERNDSTNELLIQLINLRNDPAIQHGEYILKTVTDRNSSRKLLFCVRWKASHAGYAGLFNPGTELANADLTDVPVIPDELTTLETNVVVNSTEVLVPPKSTVVFSFIPKSMT